MIFQHRLGDDVAPGLQTMTINKTAVAADLICRYRRENRTEREIVDILRKQLRGITDEEIVAAQTIANQRCPQPLMPSFGVKEQPATAPAPYTPGLAPNITPEEAADAIEEGGERPPTIVVVPAPPQSSKWKWAIGLLVGAVIVGGGIYAATRD